MSSLSSNNGAAQIVIELCAPVQDAQDAGFQASLHLRGGCRDGDRSFPFTVSLGGLWLRAADLNALSEHISQWVRRPLDALVADDLFADFQLARVPGQSVLIRFGPRTGTISSLNPVVTIEYSAGSLQGEFHFVTDQSCLAQFVQELSDELLPP